MITVTGATGNIGRTLTDLLVDAGEDVVAVSRHPRQAAGGRPGLRWAEGHVGDAASMRAPLAGARALFIVLGGELNAHGENPESLLRAAADAGVERVVLVSSQVGATRPEAPSHARLRAFEAAVRASGLDFTILRPGGFASNAFAWADTIRTKRTVFAPFADVALPVVDPADIAAVAAKALRENGHGGRVHELTGPELISPRQQTAAISAALGEEVTFVELSREEAYEVMSRFMPREAAAGTLDVLGAPLPAELRISPDVETALGRPAGGFGGWVRRNLPAFR
ncbi:SDR family oxidoreductase [Streptomyces fuscichromogenes]|uniref:NmrA family transcriptional regulator n=1 Tax=Streptomyces fuscichromogenes TaxID=1324013 RepID=A0A917X8S8_9ACTN|nr:NAD(P)H-binding protein [Streptomyces fuscichromogenes]GGM90730.1 NmrA family transcriptional regulator [Streptomyces fuscichromogenes]